MSSSARVWRRRARRIPRLKPRVNISPSTRSRHRTWSTFCTRVRNATTPTTSRRRRGKVSSGRRSRRCSRRWTAPSPARSPPRRGRRNLTKIQRRISRRSRPSRSRRPPGRPSTTGSARARTPWSRTRTRQGRTRRSRVRTRRSTWTTSRQPPRREACGRRSNSALAFTPSCTNEPSPLNHSPPPGSMSNGSPMRPGRRTRSSGNSARMSSRLRRARLNSARRRRRRRRTPLDSRLRLRSSSVSPRMPAPRRTRSSRTTPRVNWRSRMSARPISRRASTPPRRGPWRRRVKRMRRFLNRTKPPPQPPPPRLQPPRLTGSSRDSPRSRRGSPSR